MNISDVNRIFRKSIINEFFIPELTKLDFKKSNVKHPEIPADGLMQSNLLHIFFDVETGDIINVKLRNEINVERTMPLMDNIIKQHRVKENNQPVMSELNARAEDYHSKETEVETNFMLSDVTDNGNDSEYSYETE